MLPPPEPAGVRKSRRASVPVTEAGNALLEQKQHAAQQEVMQKLEALEALWRPLVNLDPAEMGLRRPDKTVLGLQICERFLDEGEASRLRDFFDAHLDSDWSPYEYGEKKVAKGERLSSTLQRIDWGEEDSTQGMVAEGRTGQEGRRSVKVLDFAHSKVLNMVSERMQFCFKGVVPQLESHLEHGEFVSLQAGGTGARQALELIERTLAVQQANASPLVPSESCEGVFYNPQTRRWQYAMEGPGRGALAPPHVGNFEYEMDAVLAYDETCDALRQLRTGDAVEIWCAVAWLPGKVVSEVGAELKVAFDVDGSSVDVPLGQIVTHVRRSSAAAELSAAAVPTAAAAPLDVSSCAHTAAEREGESPSEAAPEAGNELLSSSASSMEMAEVTGVLPAAVEAVALSQESEIGEEGRTDGEPNGNVQIASIKNGASKGVLHIDADGKVLLEYRSAQAASFALDANNTKIGRVCNGLDADAGGLFFRWKDERHKCSAPATRVALASSSSASSSPSSSSASTSSSSSSTSSSSSSSSSSSASAVAGGRSAGKAKRGGGSRLAAGGDNLSDDVTLQALWPGRFTPNALQFTQIEPSELLGNHNDHRGRWANGIGTVAWSSDPAAHRANGKRPKASTVRRGRPSHGQWTLTMQRAGHQGRPKQTAAFVLPVGAAYIISGEAQGCTSACRQGKGGHSKCGCCWTHGVSPVADAAFKEAVRQSITIRRYNPDWGR